MFSMRERRPLPRLCAAWQRQRVVNHTSLSCRAAPPSEYSRKVSEIPLPHAHFSCAFRAFISQISRAVDAEISIIYSSGNVARARRRNHKTSRLNRARILVPPTTHPRASLLLLWVCEARSVNRRYDRQTGTDKWIDVSFIKRACDVALSSAKQKYNTI